MSAWVRVCAVEDLQPGRIMRLDIKDKTYAVVRVADGTYYALDGYCTHERTLLTDGLVTGFDLECPAHFGAFDVRTGEAVMPPACVDLRSYPVRIDAGEVFVELD
ncbi:MAG TPA: non-heme iron oxygenase ferredoxin subunit [Bauldia sp.]|nr:non-heme iron oxygenase ferredoxin subunit [Bauldia sp.]